jgi:hypothetical protein
MSSKVLSLLLLSIFNRESPSGTQLLSDNFTLDLDNAVGSGAFKTAYNLKGQPDLLVVLLKSGYQATEIKKEIGYLKSVSVSVSVSDESLELTQPSFKFSNISPARLDSSVCWVTIFKSSFH